MKPKRLTLLVLATACAAAAYAQPSMDALFPIPEDAQRVLEQRCIFCHGEVIDGEAEIREDLDLSSEAAIRDTLADAELLLELIEDDEMPQEAKLSYRLRKRPEMQQRLREIKSEYEANEEKEILLKWLRGAVQ